MRRSILVLALVLSVGAAAAPAAGAAGGDLGRYIVVLSESASDPGAVAAEHAGAYGAQVTHVYRHALSGYAAQMSSTAAARVSGDPRVAFVEADQPVAAFQDTPTGIARTFAASNPNLDIDGADDYRVDVDVAIIDTGIDYDHPDLSVVARTDCTGGGPLNASCKDDSGDDGNGHGTHVAGTVAAIDNGIGVVGMAPGARLWAVKVLGNDGSGWLSWIIAGIDWVTARHDQIEVANMSLGCECDSDALDQAISNSVAKGLVYAVATGNSDKDAVTFSPANHPDVITVSALADFDGAPGGLGSPTCRTDEDDTLANFSNWGSLVEVAAPGVCILSTWKDGGYNTISGTSMASPHVAGAAALLASGTNDATSKADADAIRQTLIDQGNLDWFDDSGDGIQEPLLDVGDATVFAPALVAGSGGGSGGNAAPVANDDSATTQQDTPITIDVLANDSDADGDLLAISSYDPVSVAGGSVSCNTSTGDCTYTPPAGFAGDDTFTYRATDGTAESNAATVTISAPPSGMHVGDLDGASTSQGRTWTATVTATVHRADESLLDGATVTFTITVNGTSTTGSCTTGNDGQCSVSVSGIAKRNGSATFAVTGVTHATQTYSSGDNHDPDGDSDGTTIAVQKP